MFDELGLRINNIKEEKYCANYIGVILHGCLQMQGNKRTLLYFRSKSTPQCQYKSFPIHYSMPNHYKHLCLHH